MNIRFHVDDKVYECPLEDTDRLQLSNIITAAIKKGREDGTLPDFEDASASFIGEREGAIWTIYENNEEDLQTLIAAYSGNVLMQAMAMARRMVA